MKTSPNNVFEIEQYLFHRMNPSEKAEFKARILREPILRANVAAQRLVYSLIRSYGRRKTKVEVKAAYHSFMTNPLTAASRREVSNLFTNQ